MNDLAAPSEPEPSLDQPYDPAAVEPRWYSFWEKHRVFAATDSPDDTRPVYVVPMPPPNVTGSLHMGHALFTTLEDALVRWHRMRGFNVLWQPGTDHAGIATQLVVERQLAQEGSSRHAVGRDPFVQRVWQWRRETGDRIHLQQRLLGASADWSRSKFTMDPAMSRAVVEAFVRLYEQGLMYRATRLVNWCPECATTLSDLEVESDEGVNGELFEFAYPVEGGGEVVVATTRPETMLGDTAVAVHPDDPRYEAFHGKRVRHPFVDRTFPIITDAILVDPRFGTGAVKVTPAHDFDDFATGKRHGLQEINILNFDGTLNANAGRFAGLDRKEARRAVKHALADRGLARAARPHVLTLPRCSRSGGVVEPMISTQWFLAMRTMADRALEAVHSGHTVILPSEWTKTYDHFLGSIQDWCVSRQLWWGHQIPAWHGPDGAIKVARERPAECGRSGHADPDSPWKQDPDVLDTWFSSALWPFSTLGWPDRTPALAKFYPASDLETGYDILFFWVARMMMFGLHFMDRAPFRRVLLHGMVVDETGEKMSKVKGNVIDPLDLISGTTFTDMVKKTLPFAPETEALAKFRKGYPSAAAMGAGFPAFGADAVRFTLATYPPSNKRIALAPKRIEGNRHFLNKIWNATRLALELLDDFEWPEESRDGARPADLPEAPAPNVPAPGAASAGSPERAVSGAPSPSASTRAPDAASAGPPELDPERVYNRWIRSRFAATCEAVHAGFDAFRIDEAALASYHFFWDELCSWYLEIVKPILRPRLEGAQKLPDRIAETRTTLAYVVEGSLRLMHPFMPFITEELWQRVPRPRTRRASVAFGPYPTHDDEHSARSPEIEGWMDLFKDVVSAARTLRSEHDVDDKAEVPLTLRSATPEIVAFLGRHAESIRTLVRCRGLPRFESPGAPREGGTTMGVVAARSGPVEVVVGLRGLIDRASELARIERQVKKVDRELAALDKKLGAPGFAQRAPKDVVDETRAQRKALVDAKARLDTARELAEEL